MMDLSIREIANACGGKLVLQGEMTETDTDVGNVAVSSVVIDSRLAEPQGVFIATVGERVDGHKFIPGTFAQGVVLAVTQKSPEQVEAEHGCKASEWGSYVLVEDTLQALKDIAEAYRKKLSAKIVGITGSVGKTSTKEFIAGVLSEKYHVLKTEGNFNNEVGVPLTLLRIRREHEIAVVEMGISDFGEMHRLSKMVRPNVCVITNIGQSHLNNLIDRDGILRAKSEIFDYMAEDGEICLNGEDDKLAALKAIKGHKPHFFGLGKNPAEEVSMVDIMGKGLWGSDAVLRMRRVAKLEEKGSEPVRIRKVQGESCTGEGLQVDLDGTDGAGRKHTGKCEAYTEVAVHIPLPGEHMVLNAAAAACVAGLLGLSQDEIAAGIAKVSAVSGRTNILRLPRYTIIDDCYNANPASVKAAVSLLAMADTEKVAILGDMLNLGEKSSDYHAEIGRQAEVLGIDRILCVGEESRHMFRAAKEYVKAETGISRCMDGEALTETAEEHVKAETGISRCTDREALTKTAEEHRKADAGVFWFSNTDALIKALAADCSGLVPEGSTVLIKASHDMGFAEVLKFLREKAV